MSKFKIGDRVATNGAAPKDNTMQMMPNRVGTVVGYDTDGKNKVLMDGDNEPCYIADHELDAVAATMFRVRITRTEVYEREVEVEAEDARAAIAKARENEQNNEYAELFDCPDNVMTDFSYAGAGEKRVVDIAPFTTMEISAKVDWDFDDDVLESGLAPEEHGLPSKEQKLVFTADELKVNEVVDVGDIQDRCWALDEDKLEEYVSDKLTDETGFCHNGFTFDYKINKGE